MKRLIFIFLFLAATFVATAQKKDAKKDSASTAAESDTTQLSIQTLVISYEEYTKIREIVLELKTKDGLPILMYMDRIVQDRIDKIRAGIKSKKN